jgi:hypothetical protein
VQGSIAFKKSYLSALRAHILSFLCRCSISRCSAQWIIAIPGVWCDACAKGNQSHRIQRAYKSSMHVLQMPSGAYNMSAISSNAHKYWTARQHTCGCQASPIEQPHVHAPEDHGWLSCLADLTKPNLYYNRKARPGSAAAAMLRYTPNTFPVRSKQPHLQARRPMSAQAQQSVEFSVKAVSGAVATRALYPVDLSGTASSHKRQNSKASGTIHAESGVNGKPRHSIQAKATFQEPQKQRPTTASPPMCPCSKMGKESSRGSACSNSRRPRSAAVLGTLSSGPAAHDQARALAFLQSAHSMHNSSDAVISGADGGVIKIMHKADSRHLRRRAQSARAWYEPPGTRRLAAIARNEVARASVQLKTSDHQSTTRVNDWLETANRGASEDGLTRDPVNMSRHSLQNPPLECKTPRMCSALKLEGAGCRVHKTGSPLKIENSSPLKAPYGVAQSRNVIHKLIDAPSAAYSKQSSVQESVSVPISSRPPSASVASTVVRMGPQGTSNVHLQCTMPSAGGPFPVPPACPLNKWHPAPDHSCVAHRSLLYSEPQKTEPADSGPPALARPPSAGPVLSRTTVYSDVKGSLPSSSRTDASNEEYYGTIPEDDGADSASERSISLCSAVRSCVSNTPKKLSPPHSHAHSSHSKIRKRSASPTSLADPRRHLIKCRPADLIPNTIRMTLQHAQAPVYEPGETDVPGIAHLATSADVLAYLVKHGAAASKHLFYLNPREKTELLEVVSPFDLVVVSREQRKCNHFVFTVMGVSEFFDDREAEFTSLGEWIRLSTACALTVHLPFFKYFMCEAYDLQIIWLVCGAWNRKYCCSVLQ